MTKKLDPDELFRLYTQPGYGFTDQELADRFKVRRETIFKQRRNLEQNYPFEETEHGRWKIEQEKLISNIRVNQHEALILYLATRRLSRRTRLVKPQVQNALEKLARVLYKPMTDRLVKAAAQLLPHPESEKREKILAELIRGWTKQLKVHIDYRPLKGDTIKHHTICPYLIEPSPWSDSVYVVAKTNVWDKITPFQLERIEKATLSTEPYTIEDDFDDQTLFNYAWGIWTSEQEPVQVILHFKGREAVRRLQESSWHPLEKIDVIKADECKWQAPIAEWQEMLPWIRGWGAACEVIAPKGLRDHMMGETKGMAELYGWSAHRGANITPSLEQTFADFFGE